jgi:hypothetical protein
MSRDRAELLDHVCGRLEMGVLYLRNCVGSQRGIIESLHFLARTRLEEDRVYSALRWALNDVTTETCLVALHWHQFGIGKLT